MNTAITSAAATSSTASTQCFNLCTIIVLWSRCRITSTFTQHIDNCKLFHITYKTSMNTHKINQNSTCKFFKIPNIKTITRNIHFEKPTDYLPKHKLQQPSAYAHSQLDHGCKQLLLFHVVCSQNLHLRPPARKNILPWSSLGL